MRKNQPHRKHARREAAAARLAAKKEKEKK